MKEGCSIVEADPTDQRVLDDLFKVLEVYRTGSMGEGSPYTEEELFRLEELFRNSPSVMVFLAYAGESIAGASVCFRKFSTFTAGNLINIHDICVIDEYRGMGLGRELMQAIIRKGHELMCTKITLEVREDNEIARGLYQSLGFGELDPVMNFWTKKL